MIPCKCGCGELIDETDTYGRPHAYKHGHNSYGVIFSQQRRENISLSLIGHRSSRKGKPAPWKMKSDVKERTSRERALKILISEGRYGRCDVSSNDCSGPLHAHHNDKNPFNNASENLMCLCNSHHRLADKYILNVDQLRRIRILTSRSGRRYSQLNKQFFPIYK